ncbi:hypothetical protein PATSB16_39290 [Pandoraea thiooxydans]|uniref:Uncharacterized protein n=1 Tax=Pandoraea thiooxydans TaxID=445709 RepID=A0A0U4EZG8_9BURK|nr:hypothetical protein [Pandoraea thiooxydans]ALX34819.1 hypothetical protein ABW99_20770 [Pandoraea thiooxydans]APR97263.1 hypothetical protein PATSB16_39290 [Pandoraea thiooxydans]
MLHAAPDHDYFNYLTKKLHVGNEVARCALAITQAVRLRLAGHAFAQSDSEVLAASVKHRTTIFSIGHPIPIDTAVVMPGSLYGKRSGHWQNLRVRCGLRNHRVRVIEFSRPHKLRVASGARAPLPAPRYFVATANGWM